MYRELYVDSDFSESEIEIIKKSIYEWESTTRGMVKINLLLNYKIKDKILFENENKNLLIKVNSLHPLIVSNDLKQNVVTLGFTKKYGNNFFVGIVYDRFMFSSQYHASIIHEIGHFLDLKHTDLYPAIMSNIRNKHVKCLTENDMIEFCNLYTCDYKIMNYCDPYILNNQLSY